MDPPTSNNFPCSSSSSRPLLSSSSLPPFAPPGNTFPSYSDSPAPGRDEAPAKYLANRFDPTANVNIQSYIGYRSTNQPCQRLPMSAARSTASGADTVIENSSQQPCWEPQYLGSHQDMANNAYHRPTGNPASYSTMVTAQSFPGIPPMGLNSAPGGNSIAADPLPTIPRTNEGSNEYSMERAKHFAAPTLASARDQNPKEATTPHRTFAGRRSPPYARPPAEAKTQTTRKAKEKKQVVGKDDPEALAIARALRREMQACELGHLECGPCYLRRKGELTLIRKSIEHEIFYMLAYFNPPAHQLRLVASRIKTIFGDVVETHLSRAPMQIDHPKLRTTRPGHWERNAQMPQNVDSKRIVFTRENS